MSQKEYNWVKEEYIPELVDACVFEIKDYIENNGIKKFGSMERMFRMKKFDVATSAKAIDKAVELGIMDWDKYLYGRYDE